MESNSIRARIPNVKESLGRQGDLESKSANTYIYNTRPMKYGTVSFITYLLWIRVFLRTRY